MKWPSAEWNTWYGARFGCSLPQRPGTSPLANMPTIWLEPKWTMLSNSARSMRCPWPLMWRCSTAARIATVAFMPVSTSVTAIATFTGPPPGPSSRCPLMLISPPSPCAMKS